MNKIDYRTIRNIGVLIAVVCVLSMLVYSFVANPGKGDDLPSVELDNFMIEELTDEQIAKVHRCFNAYMVSTQNIGKTSGFEDISLEDEDHDRIKFSAKKVHGIKTLQATRAKNCKLKISISCELKNGNAKIAIVTDELNVEVIDIKNEMTLEYDIVGEHEILVKILCENAEISISTERFFLSDNTK